MPSFTLSFKDTAGKRKEEFTPSRSYTPRRIVSRVTETCPAQMVTSVGERCEAIAALLSPSLKFPRT